MGEYETLGEHTGVKKAFSKLFEVSTILILKEIVIGLFQKIHGHRVLNTILQRPSKTTLKMIRLFMNGLNLSLNLQMKMLISFLSLKVVEYLNPNFQTVLCKRLPVLGILFLLTFFQRT